MIQPDIFSRSARRRFRDRAIRSDCDSRWLTRFIATELIERMSVANRRFDHILIIGNDGGDLQQHLNPGGSLIVIADPGFQGAASPIGVQCDEDRLPFADASFDLILVPGGLDTVNDLPGALVLIRRILKAGGLFLGAMAGAGGLSTLRGLIAQTIENENYIARHHPQIDVRAAGDLLTRAGFVKPVTENHHIAARYANFSKLISDLRANAMTNALIERKAFRRDQFLTMSARFSAAGDPKTEEIFSLLFMIGWAPSPAASQVR
jgi:NADH dehydrogenase [ubiquinone] 1 alpha subcomplex assembly factor 5